MLLCPRCNEPTRLDSDTAQELARAAGQATAPARPQEQLGITCRRHGQQAQFICIQCEFPLCPECTLEDDHYSHGLKTLKKALPELRKAIAQSVAKLDEHKCSLEQKASSMRASTDALRAKGLAMKDKIRQAFRQLNDRLQAKEKQLLKEIESVLQEHHSRAAKLIGLISNSEADVASRLQTLRKGLEIDSQALPVFLQLRSLQNQPEQPAAELSFPQLGQQIPQKLKILGATVDSIGLAQESVSDSKVNRSSRVQQRERPIVVEQQPRQMERARGGELSFQSAERSFKAAAALLNNLQNRQKFFK